MDDSIPSFVRSAIQSHRQTMERLRFEDHDIAREAETLGSTQLLV
jgi:hypothetical protein